MVTVLKLSALAARVVVRERIDYSSCLTGFSRYFLRLEKISFLF